MGSARAAVVTLLAVVACALVLPATAAADYPNGQIPREALSEIWIAGSNIAFLRSGPPAASWNTMNFCATRDGVRLSPGPSSSTPAATAYRDLATQVRFKAIFGRNAATPGFSNHGAGRAVDLGDTSTMRPWTDAHGGAFGWQKRTSDAPWEPWHLAVAGVGATWSAPDPGPSWEYPALQHGSRGICISSYVKRLQHAIGVPQTGTIGRHTTAAIIRFKHAHGLKPDDRVSPKLWRLIGGAR